MKCMICGGLFNEHRKLKDLFRTVKYHVCSSCLKTYQININFSVIPLKHHVLEIVSLFDKDKNINYDAFLQQYSTIYQKICFLNDDKLIITMNKVYLSEEFIDSYEQISTLFDKDIIVLTNVLLD